MSTGNLVEEGTAVGIIAAQSIGEPGTQLTLRTFHTGGVVGLDITTGLPRVEELFEARPPRNEAAISEIDGDVSVSEDEDGVRIRVASQDVITDDYTIPQGYEVRVSNGQWVNGGELLAMPAPPKKNSKKADPEAGEEAVLTPSPEPLIARVSGEVAVTKKNISIVYTDLEEREYQVSSINYVRVHDGDKVVAGQQLTEGSVNPQHIIQIKGKEAVQRYLVNEVQQVYRSQGVDINDKHIEVIARQMLTKVHIDSSGDTEMVPGEIVSRWNYEDNNARVLAEGGEPATAHTVLLGITRASLNTDSWLAAASFQETTRVLAEAAVQGKVDHLIRLKENVILGRLIPARFHDPDLDSQLLDEADASPELMDGEEAEAGTEAIAEDAADEAAAETAAEAPLDETAVETTAEAPVDEAADETDTETPEK